MPLHYVCIQVTDTGSGIPQELLSQVFEPFFTTKDIGMGTGLGLSMVHGFVGQSGGHIQLDSAPGVGTSISILLPRTLEPLLSIIEQPAETIDELANLHVLVLEDDAELLVTVKLMLEDLGCRVSTASNTGRARLLLLQRAPEIILSDIVLAEEKTGLEFVREAREICPGIPAVMMSGYASISIGMGDFPEHTLLLNKPFSAEQMRAALAQMRIKRGQ